MNYLQLAGKQRELQEALSERAAMNLDSDPSLPTKAALSMGELLLDSHVSRCAAQDCILCW